MRYLLLLLILSGCSAEYHLNKAIQIDPDILQVEYDTIVRVEREEADTVVITEIKTIFKHETDTIRTIKMIESDFTFDTIRADNGIASAITYMNSGKIHLETWARIDSILTLQDTITVKKEIITKYRDIIKTQQAKIQKYSKFEEYIRWAAWILGLLLLIGIVIFVIRIT